MAFDTPEPGASRRRASLAGEELAFDLVVWDHIAALRGVEAAGDLRQEVEALHHVLDSGVVGDLVEGLTEELLGGGGGHGVPEGDTEVCQCCPALGKSPWPANAFS